MHSSTHAVLALLLLLAAQPAHAQAPLPAGFVDAAAVVDGLLVDMRYFGGNNFVGERIDGYERPRCLLSGPAAYALAVDKRDLFKDGYISDRSGHSRGSTVDLTLVRRADARELDMGSPFDFFSPKSWPSDRSVSDQGQQNRALLAAAMIRGGFRPYDREWWHFTLNNEPFPDTYFDFPVR